MAESAAPATTPPTFTRDELSTMLASVRPLAYSMVAKAGVPKRDRYDVGADCLAELWGALVANRFDPSRAKLSSWAAGVYAKAIANYHRAAGGCGRGPSQS